MSRFVSSVGIAALQGKVIVLTGGANGIGAACVKLFCENGALVCFGDLDQAKGLALQDEVNKANTKSKAVFVKADVTRYEDVLDLFDRAVEAFGSVDCAIANAGLIEQGGWFDSTLDLKSVRKPESNALVDANLLGTLYFTRIASAYLRESTAKDRSIILLSSVAGFKDFPGPFVYQTTKHGILGLMRSLRLYCQKTFGYRINAICPSFTTTAMTKSIAEPWIASGAPVNEPIDVARIIAQVACEKSLHGESIFVEGARGWKFEQNLAALEPQWLGKEASERLAVSQNALGMGSQWQD